MSGADCALVLAGDDGVAQGLAVSMHSALTNLSPAFRPLICLLDNGLSDSSRRRLRRVIDSTGRGDELLWLQIPPERLAHLPRHPRFPPAAYSRVLVPELVPGRIRRAVYLDGDVLVRRDLSPLFGLGLGDTLAGAVREYGIRTTDHPRSGVRDRSTPRPYFNTGVLAIDLARWRRVKVADRVLEYATADENPLPFMDQDALNGVIESWYELTEDWNMQIGTRSLSIRRVLTDPAGYRHDISLYRRAVVLHFRGGAKPWFYWCEAKGTILWVRALIRTEWYSGGEALKWLAGWLGKRARYLPGIKARRWSARARAFVDSQRFPQFRSSQ